MVATRHQTFVQTQTIYGDVDYGLWIIMMDPCRPVSCSQRTPLVRDVDNGRWSGAGSTGQLVVLTHFAVTLSALQKYKDFMK